MASVQNLEEAANVASEFIYSLDNIPHEVNFILQEIRVKEARAQELQAEIDRDSARYIRHVIKGNSVPSSPSSRAPSPKDSVIPAKIEAAFLEISQLSAEKCALSQTLVDMITRTRSRLDSDIARVRFLQGETPSYESALGTSYSVSLTGAAGETPSAGIKNPALQVTESLRNALQPTPSLPDLRTTAVASAPSPSSVSAAPATKRRRTGANTSVKLSATPTKGRSASPVAAPPTTTQRTTSRLARQSYTRQEAEDEEPEEDLGEEDPDAEDDRLYCFCQKPSYGDMIACDNEGGCPFEWFHLSCVGMKQPTPEKWYCSVCTSTLAKKTTSTSAGRKGRKK